jgi:hypothetical protein
MPCRYRRNPNTNLSKNKRPPSEKSKLELPKYNTGTPMSRRDTSKRAKKIPNFDRLPLNSALLLNTYSSSRKKIFILLKTNLFCMGHERNS